MEGRGVEGENDGDGSRRGEKLRTWLSSLSRKVYRQQRVLSLFIF